MRKALAVAAVACLAPAWAGDAGAAAALRDAALKDQTAWGLIQSLSYEIGPRPAGSPAAARARDWAVTKLKDLGFENIRIEAFAKPSWTRGREAAVLLGPEKRPLAIIGLGGSVPTPKAGITAEVVVLDSLAALTAAGPNAFKGKIVLVNEPMVRKADGSGYGMAVRARYAAPEAAKRGAVAYLPRSISTGTSNVPHTGHTAYADGVRKIPAAALGVADADRLAYLAARGKVRIRLNLQSQEQPKTLAWNVSGEIRGSERPDEVIVIGGHVDAWDNCLGAIDDAAGASITLAAAHLIGTRPRRPARTIRVVLFGSEETGGASEAYLNAHRAELARIVATSESDLGADRILALELPAGAGTSLAPLADLLAPLGIPVSPDPAKHAGSDVSGLVEAGVPAFAFQNDATRYFDYHHSADDTPAIVDRAQLAQNVAAWVVLLDLIADSGVNLRAPVAPAASE